ncbi:MAG TPA: SUMF1/EgtB/PvdO family nonheme iron enzyme [Phototrophicaceae bacterium]|nr:SUMF1/EgtB/PvdO family nonheme iron enzyme [Phototrophicaceae bacterium]
MAQIFISYSRTDRSFLDSFVPLIRRVYGNDCLWYDDDIHGGADWWETIIAEIGQCRLFVYLISNEAIESSYCQAELREALRLGKPILPVIVRRLNPAYPGHVPDDLKAILARTQYLDLINMHDTEHVADLYAAIHHLFQQTSARPPTPQTAQPVPQPLVSDKKPNRNPRLIGTVIAIVIGLVGIALVANALQGNKPSESTPIPQPTTVVVVQNTVTPTPSLTPTAAPTLAPTPTLEIAYVVQTLDAQATLDQATLNAHNTAIARATAYAAGTQDIFNQTAIAERWTATPTPNITASIEVYRTQQAGTATMQFIAAQTATAAAWTDTPTPTPTWTPSATPTKTSTPTNTPTLSPFLIASTPVVHNADWTPVEQDFDGVTMVLVPAGCFEMGNDPEVQYWDGSSWVQGVPSGGQQCFDQPFWLDKYEVTNAQYKKCVAAGACTPPEDRTAYDDTAAADHPVVYVDWTQAQTYADWRGCVLPTEREWEYVARGPDGLLFPWGNDFVVDNVVFGDNSGGQTARVGSRPGGASWVGALDLIGDVWEWVSSAYAAYPYNQDDGREDMNRTNATRGLRGGSFGSGQYVARAAYRYLNYLYGRDSSFGFRLVCRPPSPIPGRREDGLPQAEARP